MDITTSPIRRNIALQRSLYVDEDGEYIAARLLSLLGAKCPLLLMHVGFLCRHVELDAEVARGRECEENNVYDVDV